MSTHVFCVNPPRIAQWQNRSDLIPVKELALWRFAI